MKVSFFFSCFMIMIYILASCSADYKGIYVKKKKIISIHFSLAKIFLFFRENKIFTGNVVYLIKQKIQQQSEKYCTTLLISKFYYFYFI